MTLLDLKSTDINVIQAELAEKVEQSPAFFTQSPIVFGLDQLSDTQQKGLDLAALCQVCRDMKLLPTATRGGIPEVAGASLHLGLAVLPKGRKTAEASTPVVETPALATPEPAAPTRIITTPIRSGQQIYARGGDLIVMAAISAGAEVLADGNIHIYGALRGRALAGVQGNQNARIFCSSQEAELVAVAGEFMVDEVLRTNHWKEAVQIYLAGGKIQISLLPKQN